MLRASVESLRRQCTSPLLCFVSLLLASGIVFACQPQTKQDRAGVGPDVTLTPAESSKNENSADPDLTAGVSPEHWEESLKRLCDTGQASSCSQLAYEAQRAGRMEEAISLLTRACLVDAGKDFCSQPTTALRGLARACLDLAPLYMRKGRAEEAAYFKKCACERSFKSACL